MEIKNTHGGRRRNSGRKAEIGGLQMKDTTVLIDDLTKRKLKVVGMDNVSRGVREAARIAYEVYQRSK